MQNPFERHGIGHLSPSQINLFQAEPAMWCLKYLFGYQDAGGPAAWRGLAIEAGTDALLSGQSLEAAVVAARNNFLLNSGGEITDQIEKQFGLLVKMLEQVQEATRNMTAPISRQIKTELWIDGVSVPIIGYIDYLWEDLGLDLKTTERLPSEPRATHVRQVAIYREARRGTPFQLLYVTDKRHALYSITDEQHAQAMRDVTRIALSIQKVLAKSDCREEVTEFYNPNLDSFYYSSDESRKAAKEIWK